MFFVFFFQIDTMCLHSHCLQCLFKVFSFTLSWGKTYLQSCFELKTRDMFFQCCSVCIPPHHLVPMIQSLYQMLPCFPSVPHPACWDGWVIRRAGGRLSQSTWLILWHWAQFHSIMSWPALLEHHYPASPTCVLCFVVHFDAVWCCFAIWLSGSFKTARALGVVPCLVCFVL